MFEIGKIIKWCLSSIGQLFDISDTRIAEIKDRHFEIEPEMVTPNVVRMNMDSFRQSARTGEVGR